jgi:hypothetical protein
MLIRRPADSDTVDARSRTLLERIESIGGRPSVLIAVTVTIAVLDRLAGPHVSLGVLYLVPLALAAWCGRTWLALAIALALPMARLSYFAFDVWEPPGTFAHVAVNAAVRLTALVFAALLIRRARRARELERELATLRGLLPICMYCKRIQDAGGQWHPVEQYLGERSDAAFTHRVCPYCTDTHRGVFLGSAR